MAGKDYDAPMKTALPAILLCVLLIAFRIMGAMTETFPNAQPLAALCFCAVAFVQARWIWIAFAAWIISYPIASIVQGYTPGLDLLGVFLGFAAVAGLAWIFRKRSSLVLFGGVVLGSLAFYFLTNTVAWMTTASYAKTFEGFFQAQWNGLPGYPPAWVFLRNALGADLLFTGLFLLANRAAAPALSPKSANQATV